MTDKRGTMRRHRRGPEPVPFHLRLWDKIVRDPGTGCWIWTGSQSSYGYGQIATSRTTPGGRRLLPAHRVVYEVVTAEEIPDDADACHKCDTPACVNPDHIFIGTRADNMRDAQAKGRLGRRLTAEDVRFIRREVAQGPRGVQLAMARHFGVDPCTVNDVVKGRTWRHVS